MPAPTAAVGGGSSGCGTTSCRRIDRIDDGGDDEKKNAGRIDSDEHNGYGYYDDDNSRNSGYYYYDNSRNSGVNIVDDINDDSDNNPEVLPPPAAGAATTAAAAATSPPGAPQRTAGSEDRPSFRSYTGDEGEDSSCDGGDWPTASGEGARSSSPAGAAPAFRCRRRPAPAAAVFPMPPPPMPPPPPPPSSTADASGAAVRCYLEKAPCWLAVVARQEEEGNGREEEEEEEASSSMSSLCDGGSVDCDAAAAAGDRVYGGGDRLGEGGGNDRPLPVDTEITTRGAPDSKYATYLVNVDPDQDDLAVEIPLFSFARPHMRAFHMAWLAFFVAFFTWFAMTPLLAEIAVALDLDHEQLWTSSVLAVASSALTRTFLGPLNDKYGARWVMAGTLLAAAVPTGLAGWLMRSVTSLYAIRFFIGVAGSSFVTCQFWTTSIFAPEIAGTANALAAGWGNLGGGVAQVVMGSLLFPAFRAIYANSRFVDLDDNGEPDSERACELSWRTILVFPALSCVGMAFCVILFSDDGPKGNVLKRRKDNLVEPVSAVRSLRRAGASASAWMLAIQYGCCFGVEITMTQAASLYFKEEFGQSTESAAAIASVFGWMNLFARGIGGFCSDVANSKSGMRGRLICQGAFLIIEGVLVILFSLTETLAGSIVVMVIFSLFVQAAEGSTFGIVPYVSPSVTGSVSGLVGAGGNIGGVGFALLFREFNYRSAFLWMGCFVMTSAVWSSFIFIPGHRGLFSGQDAPEVAQHRRQAKLPGEISVYGEDVESPTTVLPAAEE